MKERCGFYSKPGYCEWVVEEFGGRVREGSFPPPPVDEILLEDIAPEATAVTSLLNIKLVHQTTLKTLS